MTCKGDSYPGGNQTLNFDQIQQLWVQNGGPPGWAPLMAGIAMAESSGHWGVLNDCPDTGDYSVGLWQINYYGGMLSGRSAEYGPPTSLWNDPNMQAKAAISLFGGGAGLGNWTGDAAWRAWTNAGRPQQPSAATVASWGFGGGTAGALPAAGGAAIGGVAGNGSDTGTAADTCLIKFPGVAGVGSFCVISKPQAKAVKGALLLGAGGILMGLGGFEVVMVALKATNAGRQVSSGPAAKVVRSFVKKTPARMVPGVNRIGSSSSSRAAPRSPRAQMRMQQARHTQRLEVDAQKQQHQIRMAQERGAQRRATAAQRPGGGRAGARVHARAPRADSRGRPSYFSAGERAAMRREGFEQKGAA